MSNTIVPHPQLTIPAQPGLQHQPPQIQKKLLAIGEPFTDKYFTWKVEGYDRRQRLRNDPGRDPQQPRSTVFVPSSVQPSLPLGEQGKARTIPETREPSDAQIHDGSRGSKYDMLDLSSGRSSGRDALPSRGQSAALHRTRTGRQRDARPAAPPARLAPQACSSPASPDPVMQELRRTVRTTYTPRRSYPLRPGADGEGRLDGRSQRRATRPTLPPFAHLVRTTASEDAAQQQPQHHSGPSSVSAIRNAAGGCHREDDEALDARVSPSTGLCSFFLSSSYEQIVSMCVMNAVTLCKYKECPANNRYKQRHAVQVSGHIFRKTGQGSGETNTVVRCSRQFASHRHAVARTGTQDGTSGLWGSARRDGPRPAVVEEEHKQLRVATPLEAGVRLTQELAKRTALVHKINRLRGTHEHARARHTITHDGFARLKHQAPRNVGRLFCGHHAGRVGFLAVQSLWSSQGPDESRHSPRIPSGVSPGTHLTSGSYRHTSRRPAGKPEGGPDGEDLTQICTEFEIDMMYASEDIYGTTGVGAAEIKARVMIGMGSGRWAGSCGICGIDMDSYEAQTPFSHSTRQRALWWRRTR
ncbi:predicted protein [Postia placenta Mad-698-R]|nr:predicted protein [Postia placenta Mad-698-R]